MVDIKNVHIIIYKYYVIYGLYYLEFCRFELLRIYLAENVIDAPCFHHKCTKHKREPNGGSPDVYLVKMKGRSKA